jgi:hypothetical protein
VGVINLLIRKTCLISYVGGFFSLSTGAQPKSWLIKVIEVLKMAKKQLFLYCVESFAGKQINVFLVTFCYMANFYDHIFHGFILKGKLPRKNQLLKAIS